MKVAYFTEDARWLKNRMFDAASPCNTNDVLDRYIALREYLSERDIELNTYDVYSTIDEVDVWLMWEPTPASVSFIAAHGIDPSNVVFFLHEPPAVNPWGWNYIARNHSLYQAVLSWESNRPRRDKKFFHYHFPVSFDRSRRQTYLNATKQNLALMMHSNKSSRVSGELYSFRRKVIRAFEDRGDQLLNVFGYGWNDPNHPDPFTTTLYRGTTEDKLKTYSEHYFSICIDNCVVPGYITYDPLVSMAAGTVPVYVPMPDSTQFIPADTFIDLTTFKSLDDLVDHLNRIASSPEYEHYRDRGWEFVTSERFYPFTVRKYCEDIFAALDYVRSAQLNGSAPTHALVKPEEAVQHLNPHFSALLPLTLGVVRKQVDPLDLVTGRRFDVVAKYLYVKCSQEGERFGWARELYDEHIMALNGGEERDGTGKKGIKAFRSSFDSVIDSVKSKGFDERESMIPVSNDNYLIDGSHRLAASLYFQVPISALAVHFDGWTYDWSFFRQRGMSVDSCDRIGMEYIGLKKGTRLALLFPSAEGRLESVREILSTHADIFYEKEIFLRDHGPLLLMSQIYKGEQWLGHARTGFGGAQVKAVECFRRSGPVRLFVLAPRTTGDLRRAKEDVRAIYGIGNHSMHITDTHDETVRVGQLLLNFNGIHFLNNARPRFFEQFTRNLEAYRALLANEGVDSDSFCLGGSAVLALYGLREARDIDYLHVGGPLQNDAGHTVNSHRSEETFYPYTVSEIVSRPGYHFHFDGIKVASLGIIKGLKERRGEAKDLIDLQLMDAQMEQNDLKNIQQAEYAIEQRDLGVARDLLSAVLESSPHHPDALNNLAVVEYLDQNVNRAIEIARMVLSSDPENEVARSNQAFFQKSLEENTQEKRNGVKPVDPFVSIIILNHNGLQHLQLCLDSIERHTPERHETIVVDNASTDGSVEYLRSKEKLILIENRENLGCPPARAQALTIARGDFVIFLDNDTVVTPEWISTFVRHATAFPDIGMIGPRSNYVSGAQIVQNAPYKNLEELERFAETWSTEHAGELSDTIRLVGFCMFLTRGLVEKIGNIDGSFGRFGFEDDDYTWRANVAGFRTVIAHDVFIHHTGGPQGRGNSEYNNQLLEAWEVFKRKWGIPKEIAYGGAFDTRRALSQQFDVDKHFISLPDPAEVRSLIRNDRALNEEIEECFAMGVSFSRQGKHAEALAQFQRTLSLLEIPGAKSDEISAYGVHMSLGDCLLNAGDLQEASHAFERALRLEPESAEACYGLGLCFQRASLYDAARQMFEAALALKPDWSKAEERLSECSCVA